jgi:hypothetical protein
MPTDGFAPAFYVCNDFAGVAVTIGKFGKIGIKLTVGTIVKVGKSGLAV